jgi:hypothetical protein
MPLLCAVVVDVVVAFASFTFHTLIAIFHANVKRPLGERKRAEQRRVIQITSKLRFFNQLS